MNLKTKFIIKNSLQQDKKVLGSSHNDQNSTFLRLWYLLRHQISSCNFL